MSLLLLALAALVLAGLTAATARRPAGEPPDLAGYLPRWSALHQGYDPRDNRILLGWMRISVAAARPLARLGAQPDILTAWTVWLAVAVTVVAGAGGRWPVLAAWLLAASGLADSLDGAVAALNQQATRWGYVLDSVVDRLNDLLFLAALVIVGGNERLAVGVGVGVYTLEYLRARAGNAGLGEIGVVSVGERGVRLVGCFVGLGSAGVVPARAAAFATIGLAVTGALTWAGVVQLAVVVRRRLR